MIFDKQAEFEWKAAITVTRISTNVIDLDVAKRDIGVADDLWLFGMVTTAFDAAGAGTLACSLVDDSDPALATTPGTIAVLMAATGKATLVAGYTMFKTRIPVGKITQQYLGLTWTVATGPMTAGKVVAGFTPNIDAWRAWPRGYVNY